VCTCRPIFVRTCVQNLQAEVSWLKRASAEPIVSICVGLVSVFVSVCEGQNFIQPVFTVSQMSMYIYVSMVQCV